MTTELLELAISAARHAGNVILGHYRRGDEIKIKGDGSPLILADQAAHKAITAVLGDSGIPVVSEDGDDSFVCIVSWCEKACIRTDCQPVRKMTTCRMAVSRFHNHPDVDIFVTANGIRNRVEIGFAPKCGRLAAADVDVFLGLAGSSEWDNAASQALLEGVGGQAFDWHIGQALWYGKPRRRNLNLSIRAPYNLTDFQLQHYEPRIP